MELPPFDIDDFNKWKASQFYIKECDMEDEMLGEAKDHISGGVDKFNTADGVDM